MLEQYSPSYLSVVEEQYLRCESNTSTGEISRTTERFMVFPDRSVGDQIAKLVAGQGHPWVLAAKFK